MRRTRRQRLGRRVGAAAARRRPGAPDQHPPSQRLPRVGLPGRRLPPLRSLPGQRPAQEARCAAVGNTPTSPPTSASMHPAARLPTPVMVSSRSRARANGASTRSTRASGSAIEASSCSACAKARRTRSARWPRKRPRSARVGLGELGPQPALGQLGQHLGVALPGDQGRQHRPTRAPEHAGGDRVQLGAGVLQGLLDALALGGVGPGRGRLRQRVRSRRSRMGAGGTKLPRSSPHSSSPGQPGGVARVGLAAGQDLDVAGVDQQQREAPLLQHVPAGLPAAGRWPPPPPG